MASAMFIHRIKPLEAQIAVLREQGNESVAEQLAQILRRVESGNITTVTQLNKAQEAIVWKR